MPRFLVTLNEIVARTYQVEAEDSVDAIQVAKDLLDPDMSLTDTEWVDYWGDPDPDHDVVLHEDITIIPPLEDTPDEDF